MKFNLKSPLFSLWLVVFLDMVGVGVAIPIFASLFFGTNAVLATNLNLSFINFLYGILLATYPLFQLFGAPLIGDLSDKFGRKKLLVISITGTFIGYIFTFFGIITQNLVVVFLGRAIDGFTGGNISVAQSAISDISKPEDRSKNYGLIGMAFGLGFIIGPFIGGKLSDSSVLPFFNVSIPFLFTAILSLVNLVLIYFNLKETNKAVGDLRKIEFNIFSPILNLKNIFKLKELKALLLINFLFALGFSFFTQFFQVFLIEKFNFTIGLVGDLFAYIGFCIVITQGVIIRVLSKKYSEYSIALISIFMLSIFMLLQVFSFNVFIIYFLSTFVAVFNGLVNPNLMSILSKSTDPKNRGEVFGINQSLVSLSQILPALLSLVALSLGNYFPIILSSLFIFFSGVVFFYKYTKTK